MKKAGIHFCLLGLVAMATSVLIAGCNEPKLNSKWRDREITIDGIDSEWNDCRLYYDKDNRTSLGVYNDEEYLYLNLATSDRLLQRKIIGQGMYTWFNPKGNSAKRVGILFPTGMMGKFIPGQDDRKKPRENGEDTSKDRSPGDDTPPHPWEHLEMSSPDLEIHIPDQHYENNILLEEISSLGLDAMMKRHGDRLVYELRIPLMDNNRVPGAIVAAGSGQIGIGFITKKFERKKMRGRLDGRGSGGRDGGMRGPGGGKGGAGGGGRRGGGMGGPGEERGGPNGPSRERMKNMGKAYELWVKVKLASALPR